MENGTRKRVLRPRRNTAVKVEIGEQRNYGERRNFSNSERRPGRSFGDNEHRSSYGERPRRQFGDGERRPGRSFGSQGRNFQSNERRQGRPSGEGEYRSYGERPRKAYGTRGASQDGRQFGQERPRRQFGEQTRRPAGPKAGRPAARKAPKKLPPVSGINRMIDRKPIIDSSAFSDNDIVNIPVKEVIRLNKYIANSGVCSRREADSFIQAGVVTVNGEVVTELGTKVNIYTDDVRFNGERLKGEEKVYIVMNKPKGFVTTASDPHADKTVMDLLKGCTARVFPVGRLDKSTTGVLMFTNDGEMAEKLTHPSYDKKKIYQVTLDHDLKKEDFDQIVNGVELADGMIAADDLEYVEENDHRKIGIEIHSGKNRIVRRIFESLGYEVKGLDRVYFAGLTKRGIKRGGWRYLTEGEVNILKMGAYR